MQHPTKLVVVKRGTVVLAVVAVALGAVAYVQVILRIDPFAGLKKTSKAVDPNLGLRMDGVQIQSYDQGKLEIKAGMDRMDVSQDMKTYNLYGIRNGAFFGKQGAMQFDAPKASWDVEHHELKASDGGHVKDKNVDLNVPEFLYGSDTGDVVAPGHVTGRLNNGQIDATNVKYNINSAAFDSGPARWVGKPDFSLQDAGQSDKRIWDVYGKKAHQKDDIWTGTDARATDGDIIVYGDHVEDNRKTHVATVTGHVRYYSPKANMTCDKAVIERDPKKVTMTGNVVMVLRPKEKQDKATDNEEIPPYKPVVPDSIAKDRPPAPPGEPTEEQKRVAEKIRSTKNVRDYQTNCLADKVIYWYKKGERHAEISGHPQALQIFPDESWRQAWANSAEYNGETEKLKLISSEGQQDTRMINSIGDDATADWIEVSTKDGDDETDAQNWKGRFQDYNNEVPKADKAKKPPPAGGKTGGGTGGGNGRGKNQAKPGLSGPIGQPKKKG
ncbi:MAG: hypothetical protein ACHQ50_05300 [Fimbriimonadales bacterium]